jgi:hypothetical protein
LPKDVNNRAKAAADQDDVKPIGIRATADEMNDGNPLQNEVPGEQK